MPPPTPLPLRRALWRRAQRGQTAAAIAAELRLPLRTVHHLLRRLRQGGTDALPPSYTSGGPRPASQDKVRRDALQMRRQHAGWGAGLIRVMLARKRPRNELPAERTLQRWFRQAGLGPAPRGRRPGPGPAADRAGRPHEVWQMDAAEKVRLASGARVCWLRVIDEHSGAVLWTAVFPPRQLGRGRGGRRAGPAAQGVRPLGPAGAAAGG